MAYRGTITERNPAGAWGQAFGGFANQLGQGYAQKQQLNLQNQDLQNLSNYYMDLQARQQPGFTGPPMPMPELKSLAYSQMAGRNMLNNLYIDPYKQSLMERNRALTEQYNSPIAQTKALVSVANSIAGLMDAGEEPDSPLLQGLRKRYKDLLKQLGVDVDTLFEGFRFSEEEAAAKDAMSKKLPLSQVKTSTGQSFKPVDAVTGATSKARSMNYGLDEQAAEQIYFKAAEFARQNNLPHDVIPFIARQLAGQ